MSQLEQNREERDPSQAPATEVKSHSGSLLIVEDDHAVRSFVSLATSRLGYNVLEAANGMEALKLIEEHGGKITLVLTDYNMPGMNGVQLVQALKKRPVVPAIAVMSGRFEPIMMNALKAEGITALLGKPFSSEKLGSVLKSAIATKV